MSLSTVKEEKLCFIELLQLISVERIIAVEYHNSTAANKIVYSNKNPWQMLTLLRERLLETRMCKGTEVSSPHISC